MPKQVLFIQGGGGREDYEADAKLVASLRQALGSGFVVHYPYLDADSSPDFGRRKQIGKEISLITGPVILVGHSLGASMLLVYLSDNEVKKEISGIFLISTPFWSGDEDWKQAFKLREGFPEKLPNSIPVFLYHSRDDDEVPFEHLSQYSQQLPRAIIREITIGGHQLDNDLSIVATDIKSL